MKRILVTGALGFVGQKLTRTLREQGYTVLGSDRVPDPGGSDYKACEIADGASIDDLIQWAAPLDGIIHLAAMTFIPEAHANPAAVMEVNLGGTIHLAQAIARHTPDARLVFVSTSEVYGPPQELPVNESHPLNPQNPYAISKAAADQYCAYAATGGLLDVVRMRPFNHSGAGQADTFVLSNFAKQVVAMEQGLQSPRMLVGNLDVSRDFMHVDDVVCAYELALRHGESGAVYNVCSGASVTIRDALDALVSRSSVAVEIVVDPDRIRPTDVKEVRGDHDAFTQQTGWLPKTPFESLLDELLDYWRHQPLAEQRS